MDRNSINTNNATKRKAESKPDMESQEMTHSNEFNNIYARLAAMELTSQQIMLLQKLVNPQTSSTNLIPRELSEKGYQVGDWVSWKGRGGTDKGLVVRVNIKTLGVKCIDGRMYRISPGLLERISKPTDEEIKSKAPKCSKCKKDISKYGSWCKICPSCASENLSLNQV